ncbi:MAG TPA: ABC transporter permease subunit [Anaerolineales bacterium]|nr:ABC transporter permease subunit [Anaerolineales bacterium]HNO31794.1 ABC transporter permease subunit [Anaerolineales bacterium]
MNNKKSSPWKSIQVGLVSFLVMVIFAYGFQITKVNLEELRSEKRQESLVRVMRALAKPEIFEYEQAEEIVNVPVYVPCPPDNLSVPEQNTSEPYLIVTPACGNPGDVVQVEGFNFAPNTTGPLRFVPGSDPANIVTLGRENAETDDHGNFIASLELPKRPSDEVQYIRATLRKNVGLPHLTQTAYDTWDKIVETVFLALLATVFGTFLAIPLSFIAARNLMKSVRSPLTSIAMSVLGWPLGIVFGFVAVRWVGNLSTSIGTNSMINIIGVIAAPALMWLGLRWAMPQVETVTTSQSTRLARLGVILVSVLAGFLGLFQLASLAKTVGESLQTSLGSFGFIGYFFFQVGDIIAIITPALGALAAGGTLSSILGRIGQHASEKMAAPAVKSINLILATLAGAVVFGLLGQLVEVLYEIGRPVYTLWGPAIIGAASGLLLVLFTKPKESLPIGLVVYTITRTILNALRSVEALVMAIVFVIAVGIGPFAGVMALGLHTIVSLAKLYSEQVESISAGPLEAIEATGANRLQTIIYAVIPQIVPPYISYTMYRWDINVRMSTIIGFVGGGGIGFLLQQNINLLNYRAASAQMIAIAVVVSIMDYISSVLRERVV